MKRKWQSIAGPMPSRSLQIIPIRRWPSLRMKYDERPDQFCAACRVLYHLYVMLASSTNHADRLVKKRFIILCISRESTRLESIYRADAISPMRRHADINDAPLTNCISARNISAPQLWQSPAHDFTDDASICLEATVDICKSADALRLKVAYP